jgi:membrane protein
MKLKEDLNKIQYFLRYDIWRITPQKHPRRKMLLLRQLKMILIAIRGFSEDKIQLRAPALTFYSLLSVVPIAAMIFGIAQGFGFKDRLEKELYKSLSGQKEVLDYILEFADSMLENTSGGLIAGAGLVILFWSVMKVLGNIESSFNDIWQIKKSRTFVRKFSDYLSIMLIAPIFIFLSSSLNVFINTRIESLTQESTIFGYIGPAIFFLLKFIPFVLIWFLFTILYIVMPNTKVNVLSGVIAGIIAGSVFQITQWLYITLQVGVSRYSAIYGSFAALPLLMIWLEISWLIVLFGAEISFANQNVEKYEYEMESLNISSFYKKILTLHIFKQLVHNFAKSSPPSTAGEISHHLEIPNRLVQEILFELTECKLITPTVTDSPKENAYQPASDIHQIKVSDVLEKLETKGIDNFSVGKHEEMKKIAEIVNAFWDKIKNSQENKLVKDI